MASGTTYKERKVPKYPHRVSRVNQLAVKALEGHSHEELAEMFGIARSTVTTDLRSAKQIMLKEMADELGVFFWQLIKKSQHLEKLAYNQFYASMNQKQRKRTKVKGAKAPGIETPENMQIVETVLDAENNLTGNVRFLNLVYQQLHFQANLMGYMKSSDIPLLPTDAMPAQPTIVAMPGSNVNIQVNNGEIQEADTAKIDKLRQIERLMSEIRNS